MSEYAAVLLETIDKLRKNADDVVSPGNSVNILT